MKKAVVKKRVLLKQIPETIEASGIDYERKNPFIRLNFFISK